MSDSHNLNTNDEKHLNLPVIIEESEGGKSDKIESNLNQEKEIFQQQYQTIEGENMLSSPVYVADLSFLIQDAQLQNSDLKLDREERSREEDIFEDICIKLNKQEINLKVDQSQNCGSLNEKQVVEQILVSLPAQEVEEQALKEKQIFDSSQSLQICCEVVDEKIQREDLCSEKKFGIEIEVEEDYEGIELEKKRKNSINQLKQELIDEFEAKKTQQDEIQNLQEQKLDIELDEEEKQIEDRENNLQKIQQKYSRQRNIIKDTTSSFECKKTQRKKQMQQQNHSNDANQFTVCESPQVISNIFSQLSNVFSKVIIPQSLVNLSLNSPFQGEMQSEISMQQQINQLQNQLTSIQQTVILIPTHLQELINILSRQTERQEAKASKLIFETSLAEGIKKRKNAECQQSHSSQTESEGEDVYSSDDNSSSYKSNLRQNSASSSFSKINKQQLQNSMKTPICLKTNFIQPKNGFNTPKPISILSKIVNEEKTYLEEITINEANLGFKEPKLFISEQDRYRKSSDITSPNEYQLQIFNYLNNLEAPSCILLVKQLFPEITDENIRSILIHFKDQQKIGMIELYLPRYAKSENVRIDFYFIDMYEPIFAEKENQIPNKKQDTVQIQLQPLEVLGKIQNFGDRNKLETYTDEQLLSYQKELNLKKQSLLDKKQSANPTAERIKKIQQWNEMKEVCSTVLERIAVLKGKRIQEICDDFGIQLDM